MSTYPASVENIKWRKSRTCESAGCVQVARHGEFVLVGSTASPEGPIFKFTLKEWREFLAGAKLGDFDDL